MQFDIIVVGNGILAYSTTFALKQENPALKIGIIGPASRTWGATPAAGAMLGCFGELTSSSLKSRYGQAKFDMTLHARTLWPAWINAINEAAHSQVPSVEIHQGTYVILNGKSGNIEDDNYQVIEDTLQKYDETYFSVKPRDIPGLDPIEDCRPLRAMYIPGEGYVDSGKILHRLQCAVETFYHTTIIDGLVQHISALSESGYQIRTSNVEYDVLTADQVVIAAGANSQELIDYFPELADRTPPIFAGVGYSAVAERKNHGIAAVIRTPNRSFSCGLHIVPRSDNEIYIGATNNAFLRPARYPNMGDIHFLFECALNQIHQGLENADVVDSKVGNRPLTADTYPLIGRTSRPGLWVLTGTYREGLHLSPLLAKYMARQITGRGVASEDEEISQKIELFPVERAPISTMTKQEAIEDTIKQFMAVGYEFSMNMPATGWQDMMREMFALKVTKLYDELESEHIILPPNLFQLADRHRDTLIPFFRNYYQSFASSSQQPVLVR